MTATVSNDDPSVSIERPALYVVATPIGNLADITVRALDILAGVDLILAEDTRVSRKLCHHYGIGTKMRALHDHNERQSAAAIITEALESNLAIAQISDAGTPLISDPGYGLLQAALEQGLAVHPVPGACAAIAALSVSGLATDKFVFAGFLSAKSNLKRREIEALSRERRTLIFYESPRRIANTLELLSEILGAERRVVVARELTKRFETLYRGELQEVLAEANKDANFTKGEIVLLIAGAQDRSESDNSEALRVLEILRSELTVSQAVKLAAKITGVNKNQLYDAANSNADRK